MIPALLVDAVAAYRLTKLVTDDVITQQPRDAFIRWAYLRGVDPGEPRSWQGYAEVDEDAPKLATLVTCRWCAGIWVSAGVVAARRFAPRVWAPVADVLAVSAAAALIARLED